MCQVEDDRNEDGSVRYRNEQCTPHIRTIDDSGKRNCVGSEQAMLRSQWSILACQTPRRTTAAISFSIKGSESIPGLGDARNWKFAHFNDGTMLSPVLWICLRMCAHRFCIAGQYQFPFFFKVPFALFIVHNVGCVMQVSVYI